MLNRKLIQNNMGFLGKLVVIKVKVAVKGW